MSGSLVLSALFGLAGLGLFLGLVLALAAKKLLAGVNPLIEQLEEMLPGANCGACGFGGCRAMAEALVEGKADIGRCPVMPSDVRERVAKLLGVEAAEVERRVARLKCQSQGPIRTKFDYCGPTDCKAAHMLMGGPNSCPYGCIRLGTCYKVCPFRAIIWSPWEPPLIDEGKCTGCGRCVEACPSKVLELVPARQKYFVACNSEAPGREVRGVCDFGCIACRRCERVCEFDAVHVVDNLARIDPGKCTGCGKCFEACPTGAIVQVAGALRPIAKGREAPAKAAA